MNRWEYAKELMPGGSQVVSKRSERFLPDGWPSFYSRAKGCYCYDLEGNRYADFAGMGVGACILGYADDDVDGAVYNAMRDGVMCTLNNPKETELAEKLIELHPWADMVRLGKTGGEACAVAVRLARAATGNSAIAVCGYHGWHDWYLAANLFDTSELDEHLLEGLEPRGVPSELLTTVFPFTYGDLKALEEIILALDDGIGTIIMEPGREKVDGKFLYAVRSLANQHGIVLIFDEVTSGFRVNVGGIHMTTGVCPDLAVFGKAMGNGYPISAVIGRRNLMEQDTFISSTMWSEATGTAAALETLDILHRLDVPAIVTYYGKLLSSRMKQMGLNVKSGIPPLLHIDTNNTEQTMLTQEMLKLGYLFGSSVYVSYAHTESIINQFLQDLEIVLGNVRGGKVKLEGRVKTDGFKRLT